MEELTRTARLLTQSSQDGSLETDLDILWILLGAYLVFFMQNVLDACISTLVWYILGYSFAFGEGGANPNGFIGSVNFAMSNRNDIQRPYFFAHWLFQWAFAATAGTIVSGAVAERCQFRAYFIYTIVLTGFIYPVVVHWAWSGEGWLSPFRTEPSLSMVEALGNDGDANPLSPNPEIKSTDGLIDFAGSGVVHMTGGGAALMAAWIIGPRVGRFTSGAVKEFQPHSVALATLGVFILWFGWYGFNPVSTLCVHDCMRVASRTAVTTTLSASSGGLVIVLVHILLGNPADVSPVLNGILSGLVSITASCAVVEAYASVIIGLIGGVVYYSASVLLKKLRIDDPLDASPVHFFSGAWGVLAAGFFATPEYVREAYSKSSASGGVFYGGSGKQLGVQVLGVMVFSLWTMTLSFILFFSMMAAGVLRVPKNDEIAGLDISQHGGTAQGKENAKKMTTSPRTSEP